MIAALDLGTHARHAARGLLHLLAQVPVTVVAVVLLVVLALGAALSAVGIGVPVLLAARAGAAWVQRVDRRLANALLSAHLPPPAAPAGLRGGLWRRPAAVLADRGLWRAAAGLAVKPLLVGGLLLVAAATLGLTAALAVLGVEGLTGLPGPRGLGPFAFGPPAGAVLLALAVPAALLAVAALEAAGGVLRAITRGLLMPAAATDGPVRELLAQSLGDRSVAIAYWLPEREVFVDEAGRPVELPEVGSGRAWTAVERDGRRVAAIVHDASLDTSGELVEAAAAASSLAIDNERLKADLRARLEELQRSRLRIVEAADAARRRIERDLHDGAQQHLVALALQLRLLRARMGGHELAPEIDGLLEQLRDALDELRELARGIHPAILTEQGIGPAVRALTGRCPFVVEESVSVPGRLAPAVEAAVYFVVAEGLTNVGKYAETDSARVAVEVVAGEVVVRIEDDGRGGATLDGGTGLRGLQDRVWAVGGRLWLDSPPGGGTRLGASIPCGGALAAPSAPPAEAVPA